MGIQIVDIGRLCEKSGAICATDPKSKSVSNTVREDEIDRMLRYYDWFIMSQHVLPIEYKLSQLKRVAPASCGPNWTFALSPEKVGLGPKRTVSKCMKATYAITSKLEFFAVVVREKYIKICIALLPRSLNAYVAWDFSMPLNNMPLETRK
ncbi:hypothetical protein OAN307_c13420 [Octadecabacter antarcticus 307]|uniref:Uncharacterized protein n=1 Tax=Octadecabacter antarcticus 307 TaxID=391626 RepID=M9R492_9RHOB|nr:hypothetical protein [Octadecabacter antarcticus]AGI67027.1 hypothetical protein OAN307_c13420 [Octadecabacter antarcticus 307]